MVRVEGTPYLCQTDEVGEICVSSGSTGVAYYGLPGMTKNVFEVSSFIPPLLRVALVFMALVNAIITVAYLCFLLQTVPVSPAGVPVSDRPFTRTSLLGFVGPVSFNMSILCSLEASASLMKKQAESIQLVQLLPRHQ